MRRKESFKTFQAAFAKAVNPNQDFEQVILDLGSPENIKKVIKENNVSFNDLNEEQINNVITNVTVVVSLFIEKMLKEMKTKGTIEEEHVSAVKTITETAIVNLAAEAIEDPVGHNEVHDIEEFRELAKKKELESHEDTWFQDAKSNIEAEADHLFGGQYDAEETEAAVADFFGQAT